MALSYQNYTGDNVTDTFSIPFTYTDTSEISVTVDGVAQTGLTFPSASTVQLTSPPATSTLVQVRRSTDLTARAIDYVSGSVLTEEDLDNANIQVFHAAQEAVDKSNDGITLDSDDKWNAQSKVIKNVATPVSSNDASNKAYVDTVAGSASAAAASAAAAATSATAAATSATNAATSATNSATSAASSSTSASNSAASASSASASAATATTQAGIATTKAGEASTSASNAATSESNAASSASAAATSETNAASSASTASTAATNAATSETNAATSETNAATSATAAASSATSAASSASTATTKASEASTSATNAATSASSASSSATAAATSATNAATSETNAASSATSASSAQTAAESAQTAAESARDATLAAYDNFDDRYLGVKSSDPTLDNDGNALVAGTLYFNSTDGSMKLYNGSAWVAAYVSGADYLALSGGTMTGDVSFGDNNKAIFGAGSDLQLYHDGTHSYIYENGTGSLRVRATEFDVQQVSNGNSIFRSDGSSAQLLENGTVRLETTSTGIDVTGNIIFDGGTTSADINFGDNDRAKFGAGNDLQIWHSGTSSNIQDSGTGNLNISADQLVVYNAGASEKKAEFTSNGAVDLYYDNVKKFETTSYGVDISGSVVADTHNVSSASGAYVQNFDTYQHFKYEMSGNVTLNNPTTEKAGQSGHMIFIQDATGGRTLSLGTDYETVGGAGITLSSAANATDIVPYVVLSSGRILLGTPQLAFA